MLKDDKRKVIILTECGRDIGYGHLSRCSALLEAACSFGLNAEMVVSVVGSETFDVRGQPTYKELDWFDERQLDKLPDNIYYIVDSYYASTEVLKRLSEKSSGVVYIDDTNRVHYPKGIVVNMALAASRIPYPKDLSIRYLLGPKYSIMRNAFCKSDDNIQVKSGEVKKVLVTFGGADFTDELNMVITRLRSEYTEVEIDVVVNPLFADKLTVDSAKVTIHSNLNAESMRSLMLLTDLAITAAGQIIYELMITRTPFIPIMVANNQQVNIDSLIEHGIAETMIDIRTELFIEEIMTRFCYFQDEEKRFALCKRFDMLIDSKGKDRIILMLLIEDLRLRKARMSDCEIVFAWANDKKVRENSFNSDKIDFDDHCIWFEEKVHNKSSYFYIAECGERRIGQIRVEVESGIGVISFSVDYSYRGMGIGTRLLRLISDEMRNNDSGLRSLIGYVKVDNISSQKAFERNGFTRYEDCNRLAYKIDFVR